MPTYLDTKEAATMLGIDQDAVRNLCKSGRMRGAIKEPKRGSWLIPSSAIAAWLAEQSGEYPGTNRREEPGDSYRTGNITGSNVAIGPGAKVSVKHGLTGDELGRLFELIYKRIETRPEETGAKKEQVVKTVQKIETEVSKGKQADPNKVEQWLKTLAKMAPDILDVTLAALASPAAAIAEVIRKVVAKARQETGSSPTR